MHASDEPESAPQLEPHERKKAREEESLNADATYEVVRHEGATCWAGVAALNHARVAAGKR